MDPEVPAPGQEVQFAAAWREPQQQAAQRERVADPAYFTPPVDDEGWPDWSR